MGGCYRDESYRSSSSYSRPATPTLISLLREVFNKGLNPNTRKQKLVEAFQKFDETKPEKRFIRQLFEAAGIQEAKKEFPDLEIESKLDVKVVAAIEDAGNVSLADFLTEIKFPVTTRTQFLKDDCNIESTGVNHFFGTDNKERFVLIEKGEKWYLKQKGSASTQKYGIEGEEYVLLRSETRELTDPLIVAQTILEKYGENGINKVKYTGALEKAKVESFLVNTDSGRLYSLVASNAKRPDGRRQIQIETEYAGYVPGFHEFEGEDLEDIVEDVVEINNFIVSMYNADPIAGQYRVRIQPTTESKYEFLAAERQLALAAKNGLALIPTATLTERLFETVGAKR